SELYTDHRHLHSFPTRRSSDLNATAAEQNAKIAELREQLKPVEKHFSVVLETEPTNVSALRGLKNYYDFTENEEKSKEIAARLRSEEHTSELQSRENLVCRLLL